MTTSSDGLRVLLVEDEMMVALLLEDMLAELGHTVVGPLSRIDKAVEAARQQALDAAVLDVNLNGQAVYPVAEALAARGVPFVFATGYGSRGLCGAWRGRPVLQKPFQRHDLQRVLAALSDAA